MAEGKDKAHWNHTADLMAHLANLQRTSDHDRLWARHDFHPYLKRDAPQPAKLKDPALI